MSETPVDKTAIRHASTVIVLRDAQTNPRVLMGQRGASAAFMPNKFVFPGGAVDPLDATVPLAAPLGETCHRRLADNPDGIAPEALAAAAIREIWEETGLIFGRPQDWPSDAPQGWRGFAKAGFQPDASGFHFIFRAITPKGRPRRFDARFFLVQVNDTLASDPDDFSRAEDELSHLQWIPVSEARSFDLPFITEVVLAEVEGLVRAGLPPASVPFFDNSGDRSEFRRLT